MVKIKQVKDGIIQFLESDVLPQITGFKKIAFASMVALAADGAMEKLSSMKDDAIISMTGIFTENGMVDIDRVYNALHDRFDGEVRMDVPMIGSICFTKSDLERCYNSIINRDSR